ncbi:MAG: HAMP domain-containing protein [Deltaproteobacteria bacterium]|nr:HAMP domain-containing protein [Deltaproteobacteria bacterium]MBW2034450.1 HAMP domain-containing protein [Deltaproteobacteria bacterium]
MRFPLYSLRTWVLMYMAFLAMFAMLLVNVVMVKFAVRDLLTEKLKAGRLLLHAVEQRLEYEMAGRQKTWENLRSDPHFRNQIASLLKEGGFSHALIVNRDGTRVFGMESFGEMDKEVVLSSRKVLATRKGSHDFSGSTWGVIWLSPKRLNISAPMFFDGHLGGATTICADLIPLYQQLRDSEKIILLYILLNTIVFVLFGIYFLSRTVVKPIHKLLRITEEFEEGETFPQLADSSRNEIGQLFRSLNKMLKRLEENKHELKSHIASLEEANQELKKAQKEIIKSEKLASMGRLATGVAHEIGNPIGIVLGYLELLNKGDLQEEEKQDFLNRIESEIRRISGIIRQLLDFSGPASGERTQASLHGLITETLNMLKPQPMMASIKLQTDLKAERDAVWADSDQLKQVFLNIIMNAADAMGDDMASDGEARPKTLMVKTANINDSIEIRFADEGLGIPEKDLAQIFDPFFTTKEPGKGTGLGLSVCYRIIEGLGGAIRAESTLGKGTTIIIDIPLHQ